ncbi:hypothetical protein KCTC52924_02770 [Arenibacter antarcticus]|uniref:Uncharacterized protein n=1 Tax=Arenibacter antarcticus TaxID=2040469 RepID=A0ABW5VG93_9FLAO|nr:hypothetical protein [Arenibacter sp. H213]MCM4167190.1 hypothetical protein [Arenibacter sp. H213]
MEIKEINIKDIAQFCIENVFRTKTNKPGFVHLDFGKNIDSYQLRTIMVALKKELSKFTLEQFNKKLSYHWLVRFNQQVDTPYHLDNAGDQSFLMLGYEPSEIKSELYLADYVKYANDSATAPKDYLKKFTPIFEDGESLLEPYTTKVKPFKNDTYKIVLINNSKPMSGQETLGVFHKARIFEPDLNKDRIVNSMLINLVPEDEVNEEGRNEEEFLITDVISK